MGYYTFCCLLIWRLLTAILAHANFLAAMHIKCIYFSLWKSYDLLFFWLHLVLCFCFKPLRSENYLVVVYTLLRKKCSSSSGKSFRLIYNETYNQRFTKSERALKRIELDEINEQSGDDEHTIDDDHASSSEPSPKKSPEQSPTKSDRLYPKLEGGGDAEEQAMPSLNVSRKPNAKGTSVNFSSRVEGEALIRDPTGDHANAKTEGESKRGLLAKLRLPNVLKKSKDDEPSTSADSSPATSPEPASGDLQKWKDRVHKLQKYVPSVIQQELKEDAEAKAEAKAYAADLKRREKEEKRAQKEKLNEIRERQKSQLRAKAKAERRRQLICDSIELLLQGLRLFTTFAIVIGNIHKTFMPSYLISNDQQISNPDVLIAFTLSTLFEMALFWALFILNYYKQCRLCCRMGPLHFIAWVAALAFFGGFCMYYPMSMASEQLDMTWCRFEVGTPLAKIFY